MAQALTLVKRDLGPEAMILHTRTHKRGGILGLGARTVVEITASDDTPVGRRPRREAVSSVSPNGRQRQPAPAPEPVAGDLIRRTYAAAQSELAQKREAQQGDVHSRRPSSHPAVPTPAARGDDQLVDEMRAVKRMVSQICRQQRFQASTGVDAKPNMPDKLFQQYLSLLEQHVTEELAQDRRRNDELALGKGTIEEIHVFAAVTLEEGDPAAGVGRDHQEPQTEASANSSTAVVAQGSERAREADLPALGPQTLERLSGGHQPEALAHRRRQAIAARRPSAHQELLGNLDGDLSDRSHAGRLPY